MKRLVYFLIFLMVLSGILMSSAFAEQFFFWRERRASDCTSLTDGKYYDLCRNTVAPYNIYHCKNSLGCSTPSDWALSSGTPAGSNKQIQFNNNGAAGAHPNFTIDNSTGKVSIGTFTPTEMLTVKGNIETDGSVTSTGNGANIEFSTLSSNPSTPASGKVRLYAREDKHVYLIDDTGTATDLFSLAAATPWTDGGTTVHVTTSTDNVGIGVTAATGKLAIKSPDSTGTGQSLIQLPSSSSVAMTLLDEPNVGKPRLRMRDAATSTIIKTQFDVGGDSFIMDGNVGIGTHSPIGKFNVTDPNFPPVYIERTTNTANSMSGALKLRNKTVAVGLDGLGVGIGFFILDSGGTDSEIGNVGFVRDGADNTGAFSVRPSVAGVPTEKLVVESSGNVGMSTSTPRERLDVIGTVRATGYKSSDGSSGVTGSTCSAWKNGLCTSP